jgi:ribosomal RNA-processing protein 1
MSTPFVKQLAAHERKTRDAAVASLTQYLSSNRRFTELELLKLWKGLYYCFWHSDRVPVQQQLALQLSGIVHQLKYHNIIVFLGAFWTTMIREWPSLDALRIDKFYTLLRRFIEAGFKKCAQLAWETVLTEEYMTLLEEGPLASNNRKVPLGIQYHVIDIYLEELDKVLPAVKDNASEADKKKQENARAQVPIQLLARPMEKIILHSPTKTLRLRVLKSFFDSERLAAFGYDAPGESEEESLEEHIHEHGSDDNHSHDDDSDEDSFHGFE